MRTDLFIAAFVGIAIGAVLQKALDKKEVDRRVEEEVEEFRKGYAPVQAHPEPEKRAHPTKANKKSTLTVGAQPSNSKIETEPRDDVVQYGNDITAIRQENGLWLITGGMMYETDVPVEEVEEVVNGFREMEKEHAMDHRDSEVVPPQFTRETRPDFSKIEWEYYPEVDALIDELGELEDPDRDYALREAVDALTSTGETEVAVRIWRDRCDVTITKASGVPGGPPGGS